MQIKKEFMIMVDNLIYRTKESVNNFKEDPINNLGFLILVAIAA